MAEYTKRIIAFIDILGFKSKIDKSVNDLNEMEQIYNALCRIYKIKKDNDNGTMSLREELGVEITTFSDSAVISYPAERDNLFYLLLNLIHLQLELVIDGVLIRGGLTIGDLYHDGNIVFGPAMNKAYEMESKIANYPRIIIDEVAIEQYYEYCKNDKYSLHDIYCLLKKDNVDNLYIVDMLKQDSELNWYGNEYYSWLSDMREIIVEGLNNDKLSVKVKYQWLKNYFNDVVTDDSAFLPVPEDELESPSNSFRNLYTELKI